MKLNNKGFVVSTLMYALLIVFLFLIIGIITLLANRKMILDKLKKDVKEDINGMTKYEYYPNGTAIYYNPVTDKLCSDYEEENSKTETKTGCMKWYTFNDNINSNKVNMILDHNTSGNVAWVSKEDFIAEGGTEEEYGENGSNIKGPLTALKRLEEDTEDWKVTPRLITAEEIAKITNNANYTGNSNSKFYFDSNTNTQTVNGKGQSKYGWLFDNLNACEQYGCNIEDNGTYVYSGNSTIGISGYWTNSIMQDYDTAVWAVTYIGNVAYTFYPRSIILYGVRPVITLDKKELKKSFTVAYDYTGDSQTFVRPVPGNYKIELWGAQGGNSKDDTDDSRGGYGAYSVGNINLVEDPMLYIYIGGSGKTCTTYGTSYSGTQTCGNDGGYNGGGYTRQYVNTTLYGSGGGATHIALQSGLLSEIGSENINKVIAVAGGGGGSSYWSAYQARGGNAGGIEGSKSEIVRTDREKNCTGGNQTTAGTGNDTTGQAFGHGGNLKSYVGPGGGSGLYGGGTSEVVSCGGSSYIGNESLNDKHMTCYECKTSDAEKTRTISNTCHDDEAKADCSKEGNGYAKITYLGK